jgi:uncharacterized protein YqgC (DUF456 family)
MEILIIIGGVILIVLGLIGCIIPALPGPPLAYLSLLLLQFLDPPRFTLKFLLIWAAVTLVVVLLDYFVPAAGAKRYGSSRMGFWGAVIGAVAGLFLFPPFGLLIGPVVGAVIGELIAGKTSDQAMRSAFGTLVGLLTGMVLKLSATLAMTWYFFTNL